MTTADPRDRRMAGRPCPRCRVDRCDRCVSPATCGCQRPEHFGALPEPLAPPGFSEQGNRTVAVDFDGPIHAYRQGWQGGVIYDDPSPGAAEALIALMAMEFDVVIFTAHPDPAAVAAWIEQRLGLRLPVTNTKPVAFAYVDDRAVRWTDWPSALNDVQRLAQHETDVRLTAQGAVADKLGRRLVELEEWRAAVEDGSAEARELDPRINELRQLLGAS